MSLKQENPEMDDFDRKKKFFYVLPKESRKKKVPPLMAEPLRKKELFLNLFFLFFCHLKIKIILLKTTYLNMVISH